MSTMTLARYQRVKETLFACVSHPQGRRLELFELLCADDPTIVKEVLRLDKDIHKPPLLALLQLNWFMEIRRSHAIDQVHDTLGHNGLENETTQHPLRRWSLCDN